MFVDHRGPRPAVLGGSVLLALGYFPLHTAYDNASGSIPLLCFFSFLSGLGGCMAFAAAVKTSALNWPHHRGTATAFPLAAFGLSAFFFSFVGALLFPGDPSDFLMLLAAGTCGMTFIGFFFLKVYPHPRYHPVPEPPVNTDDISPSDHPEPLHRTPSKESNTHRANRRHNQDPESGMSTYASSSGPDAATSASRVADDEEADETSSLVSTSEADADPFVGRGSIDMDRSHHIDLRGMRLLRSLEFWQLFTIMAILAGIGLMTIK